jgi:hypothetical protein
MVVISPFLPTSAAADYGEMRFQKGKIESKRRRANGVDKNLTGLS